MHLELTETAMHHKGAEAEVGCLWLTSDRAVTRTMIVNGQKRPSEQSYRAAVLFAGPDVREFGFVPGRDMVYVSSGFGCYLVPFKYAASNSA